MKLHTACVVAAFWLLVLSLTSLTLAQTPAQTPSAVSSSAETVTPLTTTDVTTTGGTADFLPMFSGAATIVRFGGVSVGHVAVQDRHQHHLARNSTGRQWRRHHSLESDYFRRIRF